jgi:hypothetical protein
MPDLHALADQVTDEITFVQFMSALAKDWASERDHEASGPPSPYGSGSSRWQNATPGAFLEAAGAWANATRKGTQFQQHIDNPWRRCAHILLAGRFYE